MRRTERLHSKVVAAGQVRLLNRRVIALVCSNDDSVLKWKTLRHDAIDTETIRLSPEAAAATCKLLMAIVKNNPKAYKKKEADHAAE